MNILLCKISGFEGPVEYSANWTNTSRIFRCRSHSVCCRLYRHLCDQLIVRWRSHKAVCTFEGRMSSNKLSKLKKVPDLHNLHIRICHKITNPHASTIKVKLVRPNWWHKKTGHDHDIMYTAWLDMSLVIQYCISDLPSLCQISTAKQWNASHMVLCFWTCFVGLPFCGPSIIHATMV